MNGYSYGKEMARDTYNQQRLVSKRLWENTLHSIWNERNDGAFPITEIQENLNKLLRPLEKRPIAVVIAYLFENLTNISSSTLLPQNHIPSPLSR